jgi:beta-glucosidase/6-phospho-beta-glucosidase/beta-galactosidase
MLAAGILCSPSSASHPNTPRCFPSSFLFGTATASHQVEGAWDVDGKTPDIWDTACRERPLEVACANVADDFFHRFREDVQLMARDGHSSFRFSIAWSRVMTWDKREKRMTRNAAGLAFYHSLLDELLQNGIEPVLTMHHWDLPVEFTTELRKLG